MSLDPTLTQRACNWRHGDGARSSAVVRTRVPGSCSAIAKNGSQMDQASMVPVRNAAPASDGCRLTLLDIRRRQPGAGQRFQGHVVRARSLGEGDPLSLEVGQREDRSVSPHQDGRVGARDRLRAHVKQAGSAPAMRGRAGRAGRRRTPLARPAPGRAGKGSGGGAASGARAGVCSFHVRERPGRVGRSGWYWTCKDPFRSGGPIRCDGSEKVRLSPGRLGRGAT